MTIHRALSRTQLVHAAVLLLAAIVVLIPAFSPYTWFDETYSMAMAAMPFPDIWRVTSCDVHPPGYYSILHIVYLLFGQNVLAFKLTSVVPILLAGLLGIVVRRDYGDWEGILFTLFLTVLPQSAAQAVCIRMYAWAALATSVCAIHALRVMRDRREGGKLSYWIVFALASVANCYLHNYGMITSFGINLVLLVSLLRGGRQAMRRNLLTFALFAILQVAAFAPWLIVVMGQAARVSGNYWISQSVGKMAELLVYPLVTTHVIGAAVGLWDNLLRALGVVCVVASAIAMAVATYSLVKVFLRKVDADSDTNVAAARRSLGMYVVVFFTAVAVSLLSGRSIMLGRYLFVAFPTLALAASIAIPSAVQNRALRVTGTATLAMACIGGLVIFTTCCYASENALPFNRYSQFLDEVDQSAQGEGYHVVARDSVAMGPLVLNDPRQPVLYVGPTIGSSEGAFECFEPMVVTRYDTDVACADQLAPTFMVIDEPIGLAKMLEDAGVARRVNGDVYLSAYEPYEYGLTVMEKIS